MYIRIEQKMNEQIYCIFNNRNNLYAFEKEEKKKKK